MSPPHIAACTSIMDTLMGTDPTDFKAAIFA